MQRAVVNGAKKGATTVSGKRQPRPSLLPSYDDVMAERARRSLLSFVKQSWHIIEPDRPFVSNWHVEAICDHLQAVSRGEIKRLLINIGPGLMKSYLVSVFWPAWQWIDRPGWRSLYGSYSEDLIVAHADRSKAIIESDWYVDNFRHDPGLDRSKWWDISSARVETAKGRKTKHGFNRQNYFTNTRMGSRLSISIEGKGTGFRGDAIVVDDPIKADEVWSKAARDRVIRWWTKTMPTRLNDPRTGAKVVVMQRLHEEDLSSHILAQGGYEHLCLPTEFDPKRRAKTYVNVDLRAQLKELEDLAQEKGILEEANQVEADRLRAEIDAGKKTERRPFFEDPRTKDGELLFGEYFTEEVLAELRGELGTDGFDAQHNQRPAPALGLVFKHRHWWRFWRHRNEPQLPGSQAVMLPESFDQVLWSIDCTFKDTDGTDYVCGGVIGVKGSNKYVLGRFRERLSFTDTIATIRGLMGVPPWLAAAAKLVEEKANGAAVISTLKDEIEGIIAFNVDRYGSKEGRARAISPQVEAGNIFLPEGAPWLEEFIEEFAAFPRGKNDDQVDMLTQALLWLKEGHTKWDELYS